MESNEFNKSLFSTVEDFLSPPSPTPVKFNKDDIIDLPWDAMFFFGVFSYVFEPRSTIRGTNGDGEHQGHQQEWWIKSYKLLLLLEEHQLRIKIEMCS